MMNRSVVRPVALGDCFTINDHEPLVAGTDGARIVLSGAGNSHQLIENIQLRAGHS